jgi:hypothetical protein
MRKPIMLATSTTITLAMLSSPPGCYKCREYQPEEP